MATSPTMAQSENGDITVVARDNGIKGKGSLEISGGTLNITAKTGDGLKSDECIQTQEREELLH